MRTLRGKVWIGLAITAGLLTAPVAPPASATCVGPLIGVGSTVDDANPPTTGGTLQPGQSLTITGKLFHSGCADTWVTSSGCSPAPSQPLDPEAPLTDVVLTLHQGSKEWNLGAADATGESYSITWRSTVPADVKPGPAELQAGGASLPVTIGA